MQHTHFPFLKHSQNFHYWLSYGLADGTRPLFLYLTDTKDVKPDFVTIPWNSIILSKSFGGENDTLDLFDISSIDERTNYLYHHSRDLILNPKFAKHNNDNQFDDQTIYVSAGEKTDFLDISDEDKRISLKQNNRKGEEISGTYIDIKFTYYSKKPEVKKKKSSSSFKNIFSKKKTTNVNTSIEQANEHQKLQEFIFNCRFYFFNGDKERETIECWLDFGSEASQYGSKNSTMTGEGVHINNIFQPFLDAYSITKSADGKYNLANYFQYDETIHEGDAMKVFRTRIVFDDTATNDNIQFSNLYADKDKLQYLKEANINASLNMLPNLKLLISQQNLAEMFHVGNYHLVRQKDAFELLTAIMTTYTELILKYICPESTNKQYLVKFRYLLPNTLTDAQIKQLLYKLHHEIYKRIPTNVDDNNIALIPSTIAGIELSAIPESDATFLSNFDSEYEKKFHRNDMILCIDCGKGTTDLGLYQYVRDVEHTNNFKRILRTGVPAAGNYFTVAVAIDLALAHAEAYNLKYDTEKLIEDWLSKIIHETKHTSHHFWTKLEKIKASVSSTYEKGKGKQTMNYFPKFELNNVSTQKLFIDELGKSINNYTHGDAVIPSNLKFSIQFAESLANFTLSPLSYVNNGDINIKQVKFSGRGMLFSPFMNALKKSLTEVHQYVSNVDDSTFSTPKNIGYLGDFGWKEASVKGLNYAHKLQDYGFMDFPIHGNLTELSLLADPLNFSYADTHGRSKTLSYKPSKRNLQNNNGILVGSYFLNMPRDISAGKYQLFYDGLNYRFTHRERKNSDEMRLFDSVFFHTANNAFWKQAPFISQMPYIDESKVQNIMEGFIKHIMSQTNKQDSK